MRDITDIDESVACPPTGHLPYVAGLEVLWRNRRFLFASTLCGLILSTAIAFLITKQYTSTAQLMPPDPRTVSPETPAEMAAGAAIPSSLSGITSSLMGTRSPGSTFLGILGSRTVQDELINRFDLRREYHLKLYSDTRKKLAACTSVDEDKKTGNIEISVTDNDPVRARDLAQAYIESLDRMVSQLSTSSARNERIFLEGRLKELRQDLDSVSKQLGQFSSQNATLDVQTQGKTMLDSEARIEEDLISTQGQLRAMEAEYSQNNVRVRALQARASELQEQLRKLNGSSSETASSLRAGELYPSLRKLPLLGSEYTSLYRQVMLQEAIYETLSKEYEFAKLEEARQIPMVKVLDAPNIPDRKSFPPRLIIMILGTVFAFFAAAVWVFTGHWWTALGPDDPRKRLLSEIGGTVRASSMVPWKSRSGTAERSR